MMQITHFTFLLFTTLVLVFGCRADQSSFSRVESSVNPEAGLLQGQVTIGPLCPVESVEDPCDPQPELYLSHKLLILREDKSSVVKEVNMSAEGKYQTELPAGTYYVDFTPRDIGLPKSFDPPQAIITAGQTTVLNIDIDTGIR